jgi:hypothetical protein
MSTEQNIRELLFCYVIINKHNFSKFANQAYFIGTNDLIFGPKATEQRRFYTTKLRDFKDKLLHEPVSLQLPTDFRIQNYINMSDDSSESSFDSPPAKAPAPSTHPDTTHVTA